MAKGILDTRKASFPLTQDGQVNKVEVKRLYDESPHIEWTPFAQSMKWDPVYSRAFFSCARWIKQKRYRLAKEQAERLSDTLQQNKPRINEDILKTLRDYPEAHDHFLGIIKGARGLLAAELAQAIQSAKSGGTKRIRKGLVGEIVGLVLALEKLTQSKYRSLLISDLSIKGIEANAQEDITAVADSSKAGQNALGEFEVMGWENITTKQLEDLYAQYLDPPIKAESREIED